MSEISVIVHDPVPHDTAPITADEIRSLFVDVGYHVRDVLVRQDYAPPYWLVLRSDGGRHIGPFSTRLDAVTAMDLTNAPWEPLSDEEFKTYLDVRAERVDNCNYCPHAPHNGLCLVLVDPPGKGRARCACTGP